MTPEHDENNVQPAATESEAFKQASTAFDQVTKPYNAGMARLVNAWRRIAQANTGAKACERCNKEGRPALLKGICWTCFGRANGVPDLTDETEPTQLMEEPAAPSLNQSLGTKQDSPKASATCAFCGRTSEQVVEARGTMARGSTGAHICNVCASAVAGCLGARDGDEARAMMAISAMQANAVAVAHRLLEIVANAIKGDDGKISEVKGWLGLAETAARIATGKVGQ